VPPNGHADVRSRDIPVPEPDLTPEAVIGRARALARVHFGLPDGLF